MARPPTYQSDEERPTTVSVRIPHELYTQAKQYGAMRRATLTELLLDGLRLRLETPADPRDILVSQDNTVIQEVQEMIRAAVQKEIGKLSDFLGPHGKAAAALLAPETSPASIPALPHDDNAVLQEKTPRDRQPPGMFKLTPRQVAALRRKRARGASIQALMDEYGISRATLFRYLKETP